MRYVLGVDGGATKTHALVVEETGRAVGFSEGKGSNYQLRGIKRAVREIGQTVEATLDGAGIAADRIEQGCFCLAGADFAEDYLLLEESMEGLGLAQRVMIKNDTMAALRAGLSRPWGIAVICGTGFNAAGRSPDGREIVFPALGSISGDWGGGNDLSQEIIRLVMRAWDGRGSPTSLTQMVLCRLDAASEEDLLRRLKLHKIRRRTLLSVVPLLFEAALAGDRVAQDLVVRMGTEIGVSANALIRRLSLEKEDVEVVLGGGIFKSKGSLLLETVTHVIHSQAPKAQISPLRHEPVVGAALLALESIGVIAAGQVYELLDASVAPLGLRLPA